MKINNYESDSGNGADTKTQCPKGILFISCKFKPAWFRLKKIMVIMLMIILMRIIIIAILYNNNINNRNDHFIII